MATREEKKAATREKLLAAAAALVAKEGVMAATLDRIAEKAGLTKGAVYSNFTGKEQLLFMMGAAFAGPSIHLDPVEGESLADHLERLGREVAKAQREIASRAGRLGLEIFYLAQRNPRFRKLYAANERENRRMTAEVFEQLAAARGDTLPMTGEQLFTVMNALAVGLSEAHTIDPSAVPDELFPKAFRLLAG